MISNQYSLYNRWRYLNERKKTYWIRDLFSQFFALTIGIPFKPESQKREEYVSALTALYKKNPNMKSADLLAKIGEGLEQFGGVSGSIRNFFGSKHSLASHLLGLQQAVQRETGQSEFHHDDSPAPPL